MHKMSANEIRRTWLKFFESKGHYIEPGASLVPHNDPTLLWINSGVAALKKYFDGSVMPKNKRITNVQKSIRTNDIENVGKTSRHHTFFEMLGNFSIGDYFRKEMIPWAYEILTSSEYFGIPKEKLYFTYNPIDEDTHQYWLALGVEEEHLIPLEGNYWQIGEGPCGPNTEVFFDRGEEYDKEHLGLKLLKEDLDNDRYIEIWGIVFSQFNAVEGVKREDYKELPNKNIDTGAGLERIACVLQNTETNFETDLFMPIIEACEKLATIPYSENKMAYRVIADHIRTCTFALSDGAMFSNDGRGYVLRRILRRAMRYGRKIGINKPFLYLLVDVVANNMKEFYPYLLEKEELVAKIIKNEEDKFLSTLNSGETLLRKMIEGKDVLRGTDAFMLYDTYGFPIELTIEICQENRVEVDLEQFHVEMEKQKERARSARSNEQSMNKQSKDLMDFVLESNFTYETMDEVTGKVIGLFKDGKKVDCLDDEGEIIFDNTNFYAESGGQVADIGVISNENCLMNVLNVSKAPNKQHLHSVQLSYGKVHVGDEFTLKIDKVRRQKIMRNHTSAHLLQAALVKVLGNHVHQEGSFVNDEYMRFDFNHFEKIKASDLQIIEELVNSYIESAIAQDTKVLNIDEAKKIGATALFDEKYGDVVRVVCFGDVSKEFCGGTHASNTQNLGCFVIESEESIASGIRRIQARTGVEAYNLLKNRERLFHETQHLVEAQSIYEVNDRLKSILKEKEELKKQNKELIDKQAAQVAKSLKEDFSVFNGYHLLVKHLKNTNRASLLKMMDGIKTIHSNSVIVLTGEDNGTYPILVTLGNDAIKNGLKAGDIVKEVAKSLNGSGGGRLDSASGAGKDGTNIGNVLSLVKKIVD